jgi:FKBP-type peptidyl-prolyl cis-trans isomerase FklB
MNMKTTVFAILAAWLAATGLRAGDAQPFKDDKDKASYAVGLNFGRSWKQQDIELNYDELLRGLKDTLEGGKPLLNEQETREVLNKFQQEITAKRQEKQRLLGEKNKKEGEAFLAENKNKPGVVTLTNGLQYKVLTEGSGEIPKPEDTVTVNYRGTLIDGTEFDSSAKAGKPATFRVTGVIPGWTEALKRMKVGSKWQLFIPSELAYRERGGGPLIGPNATLLFDVELLSIQPPPPPVTNAPLTSDIIKVPSLEEMKKGAKIETIKAEDVEKLQKQQQEKQKPK